MSATGGARQGILTLAIRDKDGLHSAYMSFLRGGGLFVPTTKRYQIGEEVFVLVNMMDEKARLPVAGKVVWITPAGAQGGRTAGIGVQFPDNVDAERMKARIETMIVGLVDSDRPTATM